ncbi:hypothetical protein Nepgr_018729 [Nepenthes gracilis]|uniref:Uncharacterized protein n=1 Tax=Nepenthes gracilis TaxID=150966 RepID=A0AAD3XTP9_NEPGR|nr:hypothetical protein Nepgr_018729 [Nepenthes gracilis]
MPHTLQTPTVGNRIHLPLQTTTNAPKKQESSRKQNSFKDIAREASKMHQRNRSGPATFIARFRGSKAFSKTSQHYSSSHPAPSKANSPLPIALPSPNTNKRKGHSHCKLIRSSSQINAQTAK